MYRLWLAFLVRLLFGLFGGALGKAHVRRMQHSQHPCAGLAKHVVLESVIGVKLRQDALSKQVLVKREPVNHLSRELRFDNSRAPGFDFSQLGLGKSVS